VLPAHQRLRAHELAGRQVDRRLVVEPQLAALERRLQLLLDRERLHGPVAHRGVEQLGPSAAALLRAVHRGVSVLEEALALDRVVRLRQRHPDARAEAELRAARPQRLAQGLLEPVGDRDGLEHPAHALADDGELVAAEARDRVLGPQHGLEPSRHLA
jgi:hypothetical protein